MAFLTESGKLEIYNWLRKAPEYITAFEPEHFDKILYELTFNFPVKKDINVIFVSTGKKPYPEIYLLHHLSTLGYTFNYIYFLDYCYANEETLSITKEIIQNSLTNCNPIFCSNYQKIVEVQDAFSFTFDLLVGFNFQIMISGANHYDLAKKIEDHIDSFIRFRIMNDTIKSFSFVSNFKDLNIDTNIIDTLLERYIK
jgi:hypothetical protein